MSSIVELKRSNKFIFHWLVMQTLNHEMGRELVSHRQPLNLHNGVDLK